MNWSTLVVVLAVVVLVLSCWLWWTRYQDPYSLVTWFDQYVPDDSQSPEDAWVSKNETARTLHGRISLQHEQILSEVLTALRSYKGLPMRELDEVQGGFLGTEDRWRPIWIRFLNEWSGTADLVPTLKNIVSDLPDVTLVNISIFHPGTSLPPHHGPTKIVQRYHYGLKIPKGDVGLQIEDKIVRWQEREGFVWDDTLIHSAWNFTSQPRIIIFADVLREMPGVKGWFARSLYEAAQRTKHVVAIKEKLRKEGIVVD